MYGQVSDGDPQSFDFPIQLNVLIEHNRCWEYRSANALTLPTAGGVVKFPTGSCGFN
jgi:hypothetical protein